MKKKKIIKLLVGVGLIVCTLSGMFIGKTITKTEAKTVNSPKAVTQEIENSTIDYKEIIVERLKEKSEFKIIQSSLREEVKIKNSKYDNKIFKNNNIVTVKGNGNYYLELEDLENNVIQKGKDIYLVCKIKTEVVLNEEEITIQEEKGCLSLYTKKLEANEYNNILVNSKKIMEEKANDEEYISIAKTKAEEKVENIINTLLQDEVYRLHFIWK